MLKLEPELIFKEKNKNKLFSIAIDGPAGSGKSTVAKALSHLLGILYVDTGAMYRAAAYYCIQKGVDCLDEPSVKALLDEINIDIDIIGGEQHIFLNKKDITSEIRTGEIGNAASDVATLLPMREKLVAIQQQIAGGKSVVMDGRDIGTVVLPNAKYKIYLTAALDERARRRFKDFELSGKNSGSFE
ncbi:MAG: (d)CMP kinase, partial [Firmicutes bacterium]|nr:(d)CMP kinase [Bacillota bacterium]